jgi:ketosteroid isomerase-like protein
VPRAPTLCASTLPRSSATTRTSRFRGRRLYARDGLVVNEWTATATRDGKALEWDGIDVFPIEDGKIKRKDVYSGFGVAREI